jgi:hypothetical protein
MELNYQSFSVVCLKQPVLFFSFWTNTQIDLNDVTSYFSFMCLNYILTLWSYTPMPQMVSLQDYN